MTEPMRVSALNLPIEVKDAETGMVQVVGPRRTKVAIVGFEEKQYRHAPMNDPEYEIWGFNHANRFDFMQDETGAFRADRWFDLHEEHAQSNEDMHWIRTCPCPLYLPVLFGDNPMAVRYPLERMQTFVQAAGWRHEYFASSFAYALVLAMLEGFETIGLYGTSMNWGREVACERANLEYWIGIAQGFGCDIYLPPESKLLTHPALYGFDYTAEKEAIEERMARLVLELMCDERIDRNVKDLIEMLKEEKAKGETLGKFEQLGCIAPRRVD